MEINLQDLDPGLGQEVVPMDPISPIGTHNMYTIKGVDLGKHSGFKALGNLSDEDHAQPWIIFQDGSPSVNGVNGATLESILLICADRLTRFQASSLVACAENQAALDSIKQAVYALNQLTERLTHQRQLKPGN